MGNAAMRASVSGWPGRSSRQRAAAAVLALLAHLAIVALLLLLRHDPRPAEVVEPKVFEIAQLPAPIVEPPPPTPPPLPPPPLATRPEPPGGGASSPRARRAPPLPSERPDATPLPAAPALVVPTEIAPPMRFPLDGAAMVGNGLLKGADAAGATGSGSGRGRGTGSGTGDGGGEGDGLGQLYDPRWVYRPSQRQLEPYVPFAAQRDHVSGWGLLACQSLLSRRVRKCRVLAEAPAGSGFGEAARRASWQFRVWPPKVSTRQLDGAWVRIKIFWELGAKPRPTSTPGAATPPSQSPVAR